LTLFEEAIRIVLDGARPERVETVPLAEIHGRVLAEPVYAQCDLPPFHNSAVDGFALTKHDVEEGVRWRPFKLVGEMRAGSSERLTLHPGETIRVLTGAALPEGTAAVAMKEIATIEDGHVRLDDLIEVGEHVRRAGDELAAGDMVVPAIRVTPPVLASIAAAGVAEAKVWAVPKVGILVTGDELAAPGAPLVGSQVYESNSLGLSSAASAVGAAVVAVLRAPDDERAIRKAVERLLEECDVVVTSGGVSVGDYDLVRAALDSLGVEEGFWRAAIKPGKPIYFGRRRNTAVFGLPGNPVSAMTTFHLFVQPYLRCLSGEPTPEPRLRLPLTMPLTKKPGRTEFVPCRITADGADPEPGRASHKASILATADGLAVLPLDGAKFSQGELVDVIPLRWGWQ